MCIHLGNLLFFYFKIKICSRLVIKFSSFSDRTALTAANHNNMHLCTFVPTCLCIFAVVAKSTVSDLCTLRLKLFLQTDKASIVKRAVLC